MDYGKRNDGPVIDMLRNSIKMLFAENTSRADTLLGADVGEVENHVILGSATESPNMQMAKTVVPKISNNRTCKRQESREFVEAVLRTSTPDHLTSLVLNEN